MNINVIWKQPIDLNTNPSGSLTVDFMNPTDENKVTESHGVYVFAKAHGISVTPLYIGKGVNVRRRINQHFRQHVELMNKIKKSGHGRKVLIVGEITPTPGQTPKVVATVVEDMLIEKAVFDEWELFNYKGTKKPIHFIQMKGFTGATDLFGKKVKFPDK